MRISDWSSDVCSSDLALDSAANQLFIVPRPVNLGSVEEGDAEIDGAVDGGDRFILAGLAVHVGADASHRHAAEAKRGDLERLSEPAVFHGGDSLRLAGKQCTARGQADRKSVVEGKRVSVRVDLGGGRIIQKKKT